MGCDNSGQSARWQHSKRKHNSTVFLQIPLLSTVVPLHCVQVYDLEKKGGSIIGGVFKLIQERKANPPPPRNPSLPPKPAGQTVGSFRRGLRTLPDAMAARLGDAVRTSWQLKAVSKEGDIYK
jgi:protoporphyrinogen oxidase